MVPELTVRPATDDDVTAIQAVAARSWEAAYGDVLAPETIEAMLAAGYAGERLREVLAAEDATLFVAESGGEVLGYATSRESDVDLEGEMSVYVDPERWGEGVGRALLEQVEADLAGRGVDRIREHVLADNDVGNAFYGAHFERVGEREVDLGSETHRANVYEREVGGARRRERTDATNGRP